jgi:hypothetical protein
LRRSGIEANGVGADVSSDRLLEIFSLMEGRDRTGDSRVALCAVAADFLVLDGASIVLSSDLGELTSLCASNDTARALVDLEIVVGEGPSIDACRGETVNESDLHDALSVRWSTYTPEAVTLGARAVFAYSIRLGAVRFGALSLFRTSSGPLNALQESDAFLMASVIGRAILAGEAGGSRRSLVGELDGTSVLDFTVHQAAGMVAVQGSMSVRDALVSLRAHAFATNRELSTVAGHVVTRTTRFDPGSRTWRDDSSRAGDER